MARFDIKIDLASDAELVRMFDAVPQLERYNVADAVVLAGATPITKRAQQLTPRGTEKDRAKRSKKQQAAADWVTHLFKTIKVVVRKGNRGGAVAVTGPQWTGTQGAGQKIYLVAEHEQTSRKVWYWGKDAGKTIQKIRNVLVQAAAETRSEQLSAMKAKLTEKMNEVWRRG